MRWARMTAVADTYHSLISDRPYRKGMSQDKAMSIIDEVRGTQLCPDCVDNFKSFLLDMPKVNIIDNKTNRMEIRKVPPQHNFARLS